MPFSFWRRVGSVVLALTFVGLAASEGGCSASSRPVSGPQILPGGTFTGENPDASIDAGHGNIVSNPLFGRGPNPIYPTPDVTIRLPYGGGFVPYVISLTADLNRIDVHFSVDTTASFAGEIQNLKATLSRDQDGQDSIFSAIKKKVPDVGLGVSKFQDFPALPFGEPEDVPYTLLSPISTDVPKAQRAVDNLDKPLGLGADEPEAWAEALWQIATGAGYAHRGLTYIKKFAASNGAVGGVGFRKDSFRVIVQITDARAHTPSEYGSLFAGTHSISEAASALSALNAHVIGIASSTEAHAQLTDIAIATDTFIPPDGTSCPTGIAGAPRALVSGRCPAVFDINADGSGLSEGVVNAVIGLVNTVRYASVSSKVDNDPFGFVTSVLPLAGAEIEGTHFINVGPGAMLSFELNLTNTLIRGADYDQHFFLSVDILGDDLLLVTKIIEVIVPARGLLDAGP